MIIECTGSTVINDHRMKLPATAPTTDKKCRIFLLLTQVIVIQYTPALKFRRGSRNHQYNKDGTHRPICGNM